MSRTYSEDESGRFTERIELSAFIARRARGVYLLNCMNHSDGVETWDAFPTLDRAKAVARSWIGAYGPSEPRLRWTKTAGGSLRAEIDLVEHGQGWGAGASIISSKWEQG